MGLNVFENEGASEKGYVEIEDWAWGFCVHFGLEFQENSTSTVHFCFSDYDITKWCKA